MAALTPPRVIVFTRHPAPGRTKTRLIPLLGPRGAAGLQRRLAARLLERLRPLAEAGTIALEVRFTGGSRAKMSATFGADVRYTPQGGGDLGARMARALEAALSDGAPAAIVVGSDVPALDARAIRAALGRLRRTPIVLGPTRDGGYYLVGLAAPVPALFRDIAWGTPDVLAQTLAAAGRAGVAVARLRTLADVDEPGDVSPSLIAELTAERGGARRTTRQG